MVQDSKLQRILNVCCAFSCGLKQFLTSRLCPLRLSNKWQTSQDNWYRMDGYMHYKSLQGRTTPTQRHHQLHSGKTNQAGDQKRSGRVEKWVPSKLLSNKENKELSLVFSFMLSHVHCGSSFLTQNKCLTSNTSVLGLGGRLPCIDAAFVVGLGFFTLFHLRQTDKYFTLYVLSRAFSCY